ncbi:PLP-dependent aminotransferase family protein [Paenibacillus sp. KS-LC4]|uniref:aminotransferase-like domain-containing protein n=1 Tax=Paenibacillus sp. KS-LC4 TaxID=2979727 RepID=UPI0030CE7E2C
MKKYDMILSDMEAKIRDGHYRPGSKLVSVRKAAELYGCSTNTISRAYGELEKRHAVYSIPQSGFYVVDKEGSGSEQSEDVLQENGIDFSSASPDLFVFPYLDFQHCLNKAIDTYKYRLFTYGDPQGMAELRETLVRHLASDQVFAKPERIFVTSGAQQALEILAKMPFPNGKRTILLEQPTYNLYLRFLEFEQLPTAVIARTAAGISLQELERKFKGGDIKFFYTMSRYHNPLGTSYTTEERKAIAALAKKYDVYIVEDDYMADLGVERGFDPIYSYDLTEHVVYLKSFSKIIFPGLRLGAAVLPEQLIETFYRFKKYGDTSYLSQAALDIYIKNGMYERHKHAISSLYTSRMLALNEALERHNGAGLIQASGVSSGIYSQFRLPITVNMEQLMERLSGKQIRAVDGKGFYLPGYLEREKFLRISISRVSEGQMDEGIAGILEEVKRANHFY